uniref:Secreted protein n=1 Tax=Trichogramma kaykai TaxID=54128 RepID=A0ABD2X1K7_9HYME
MHFSLSLCLAPHGLFHTMVHQSISCYKYLYFHSRCCQMHFSARMMCAQTCRIERYRQVLNGTSISRVSRIHRRNTLKR